MGAYRNRAIWYDRSMLQSDETIFVIPPNQSRHPSTAAPNWYDCSMVQGDETIFLVPRDQSRRFVAAANGHDRNQGFPQNGNASERRRRRMIAEHIRSKLVVRDHRDDDDGVCVICQENLNLVAQICKIVRLDCGHYYHQRCITHWLNVKNTCPLCQAPVV
ncbi:hypothetical protein SASPL_136269 [Salvia splendens]|uniref:RING-type E3 ubiquitin transferase n=1 Tax=Salvia splendens TaxID=180675 RepID=A0A8X8WZI0_SALSN|nr:uncharacterized protein LOC121760825 [Salvia splendens]KAG6404033.1 hypothetical protein SASPL_136269 [Salvia splendens]